MASLVLKPGKERSLLRRHPWVFSGALSRVEGRPSPGETVDILSSRGEWLARGAFSPRSQIRVRIWTFDASEEVSSFFFRSRIEDAIQSRPPSILSSPHTACRLVNAESDRLPGLIVDRYGDILVCQFLSVGAERWKDEIVSHLRDLLPVQGIYERSDLDVRMKEGLQPRSGLLSGRMPPETISIEEGPCRFLVDVHRGHKTGFYLDQRRNRALVSEVASGMEILNGFAYTGAFGIRALKAGASGVVNVDSSSDAVRMCRTHVDLNALDPSRAEHVEGNMFEIMRQYRDAGRRFDGIVLDPPKFVESAGHLERASRGYKDINLLAFQLLRSGGLLFTFSCSGLMPPHLFQKIVADAALDAGRDARIIRRLDQSEDHPVALNFPEGSYLKGLVCRVR
ncbi:MAG: class I SAM-dependent methyltransferase [Deltaproteobacteria bacterium]|nr:class I SAM-dependent methyltransferase [Deltaproteobacteria bacterium]